jgi:hypothetical protein
VLGISATDASKNEGTGGAATPFTFTVTRTGSTSGTASANYSVAGVGSKPTNSSDFSGSITGTVTFGVGQTTQTITVLVNADSTKEANEKFRVTLSNAVGAALGTSFAESTIVNDDGTGGKPRGAEHPSGIELLHIDPLEWFEGPVHQHDHGNHTHHHAVDTFTPPNHSLDAAPVLDAVTVVLNDGLTALDPFADSDPLARDLGPLAEREQQPVSSSLHTPLAGKDTGHKPDGSEHGLSIETDGSEGPDGFGGGELAGTLAE